MIRQGGPLVMDGRGQLDLDQLVGLEGRLQLRQDTRPGPTGPYGDHGPQAMGPATQLVLLLS